MGLNIHLYDMTYSIMYHMLNRRVQTCVSGRVQDVYVCVHILGMMFAHPFNCNTLLPQAQNLKVNTAQILEEVCNI